MRVFFKCNFNFFKAGFELTKTLCKSKLTFLYVKIFFIDFLFLHFFGFKALFKSSRHVHETLLVESFNQGGHFFLKNQDGSIQLNIGIFIKQNWIYNQKKVYHHIVLSKFNIKWGYFSIYYKNHLKLFINAVCRKRNMFRGWSWRVYDSAQEEVGVLPISLKKIYLDNL